MKTDVLFTLTGDIRHNSRALKQLAGLAGAGYSVTALGIGNDAYTTSLSDGVTCRILPRPPGSGPAFFRRVHHMMRAEAGNYTATVYHASDLYTLPALSYHAKRLGAKLVYDARERYPFVASTAGRPWVSWFWEFVERRHIHRADAVFTVSQSIASHLVASYGIPFPAIMHNVPALQRVERTNRLRELLKLPSEAAVVLHQGKMQKARGCRLLVEAMGYVEGAVLVFLGDGPLRAALERLVREKNLEETVRFVDPVPPDELLTMTASADIGVTLLEDTCLNHRYALPNKLFEYLMAGVPVLASALPEMEHVVADFKVGRVVPPEDPREIARVLQTMLDRAEDRTMWRQNTRNVFETFSWEKASETFLQAYRSLLKDRAV